MAKLSAVREFNQYGYRFYPQIWVETLKLWSDVTWVRHRRPEGFFTDDQAIAFAAAEM